jgi:phosphatidylserine/phosphatidylglycerophosphate/cardiolipin synthase-like enzyme
MSYFGEWVMRNVMNKYFGTIVVVLIILLLGFVAGCTSKSPVKSAENKNVSHGLAIMPDSLKGVHSMQAVGTIDVAFSPNGGVTAMVTSELTNAQKSIQVQAYSFTSSEIIQALINAKKRGVDVRIIIDKSNVAGEEKDNPRSQKEKELLDAVVHSGIPVKVDSDFQIAHSKIMIVDGIDIITGSFNFTYSAEHSNAENCLIIHGNKALADEYSKNWQWRWEATKLYNK